MAVQTTFGVNILDDLRGTPKNDTFVAEASNSPQGSSALSGGDSANGLAGNDRLILTATDVSTLNAQGINTRSEVVGFVLNSIEELEIRAYDADGDGIKNGEVALGMMNVTGLQRVFSSTSTANVTLDMLPNRVDLNLTGNGGTGGTTFTLNYMDSVIDTPTPQTQKISLQGFGKPGSGNQGQINIDGVETFSLITSTKPSVIVLKGNEATNLQLNLATPLTLLDDVTSGTLNPPPLAALSNVTGTPNMPGALSIDLQRNTHSLSVITGRGSDQIFTGSGNDSLSVAAGDNWVNSGAGADTITAGDGNDVIQAGEGANSVSAGNGNNDINSGTGSDVITTGQGDDTIDAGGSINGMDKVDSGAGNDRVTLGTGINLALLGNGDDTVDLSAGDINKLDSVDGGAGMNTLRIQNIAAAANPANLVNIQNFQSLVFAAPTSGNLDMNAAGTGLSRVGIDTCTFEQGVNGETHLTQWVPGSTGALTVNLYHGTTTPGVALEFSAKQSATMNFNVTGDGSEDVSKLILNKVNNLALDLKPAPGTPARTAVILNTHDWISPDLTALTLTGTGSVTMGQMSSPLLKTITATSNDLTLSLNLVNATLPLKITTTGGADTLIAGSGKDFIDAGSGNNSVEASAGNDNLIAGSGQDTLDGGDGNDTIVAGAGDDWIIPGLGMDKIDGGEGNDTILFTYSGFASQGLTSADEVVGGDGQDQVVLMTGYADDVDLSDGVFDKWKGLETLDISAARDGDGNNLASAVSLGSIASERGLLSIITGTGNDKLMIQEFAHPLQVYLDSGDDTVNASKAPDSTLVIHANDTNLNLTDSLIASKGDQDELKITATGGTAKLDARGFEQITIVDGKDKNKDGFGDFSTAVELEDTVVAKGKVLKVDATALGGVTSKAGFTFNGGQETDGRFNLSASRGNDIVLTGAGNDTITGSGGADSLLSGAGDDWIVVTGSSANTLEGGTGKDILDASKASGNNTLKGDEEADTLTGGGGSDSLQGGPGKDVLIGGDGADHFIYSKTDIGSDNIDKIRDFKPRTDKIIFNGQAGNNGTSPTTGFNFKGNVESLAAVEASLTGSSAQNDGKLEAVFVTATETLWIDQDENAVLNDKDLQIVLNGITEFVGTDLGV